jgi:hypothetical protein
MGMVLADLGNLVFVIAVVVTAACVVVLAVGFIVHIFDWLMDWLRWD